MIKIAVNIDNEKLKTAVALIIKHYRDKSFMDELMKVKTFNHTKDSGADVAHKLLEASIEITVMPYRTWNIFSKVVGHAQGTVIFVNTRKLDLPIEERVENLMHETLHIIGYSHQGNYVNKYNLGTVPYAVSRLFKDHVIRIYSIEAVLA
jgi:hypothetical protein